MNLAAAIITQTRHHESGSGALYDLMCEAASLSHLDFFKFVADIAALAVSFAEISAEYAGQDPDVFIREYFLSLSKIDH